MSNQTLIIVAILGFLAIPWTYIIVRMAARAVIRSIEERKRNGHG